MIYVFRCPICGKDGKVLADTLDGAAKAIGRLGWCRVPDHYTVGFRMPPTAPHTCGRACFEFVGACQQTSAPGGAA